MKTSLVGLALLLAVVGCGATRQPVPPIPLPPLDAQPLTAGATAVGPDYRLQPGDLLRVKFVYHPELDVKLPVRPDGGINLQVAGDVHAAGLTVDELERAIVERTSDRLREPEVSVIVADVAELKVYVGGEVNAPGFVVFQAGMTPLQAIMSRGGFTDTARLDSVLRLSPSHPDNHATRLDFTRPLIEGSPEWTEVDAGDVLYVPRSFIGDVNAFVQLYIRNVLPISPRFGAGTSF
ncbi:polysaccharide export protein [Candidatus Binatia bacterium]|nr:polysaccharide export protein [Candidatus Binatia bacterium]